jgi:hypothetical protein
LSQYFAQEMRAFIATAIFKKFSLLPPGGPIRRARRIRALFASLTKPTLLTIAADLIRAAGAPSPIAKHAVENPIDALQVVTEVEAPRGRRR